MVDSTWSEKTDLQDKEKQDSESNETHRGALGSQSGDVVNQEEVNLPREDSVDAQAGRTSKQSGRSTIKYDNIPGSLKKCDRWVCWRVKKRDGKPTKIPLNPHTGKKARSDDKDTWTSFDHARDYHENEDTTTDGIGFVFSNNGHYAGIDLDDCVNPDDCVVEDCARDIVNQLNSYTEFSPSRTGLHIIVEGTLPPGGNRSGNVEMYDGGRFFTVTGDMNAKKPENVEKRVAELRDVHSKYIKDQNGWDITDKGSGINTPQATNIDVTDEELIEKAKNADNGGKFDGLWNGDTSGYDSHSEADEALCCLLAFWTGGNRERMDDLFRQSDLMRSKWDEDRGSQTYGELTIQKALRQVDEHYEPDRESGEEDSDNGSTDDSTSIEDIENWVSEAGVKHIAGLGEDEDINNLNDRQKAACVWELVKRSEDFHVRYRRDNGTLWSYDKGIWVSEGERELRHAARQAVGSMNYGKNVLNELKSQVRSDEYAEVEAEEFGVETGKIAVRNGLLDLGKAAEDYGYGALRDLRPEDYALVRLPVEYDPEIKYDDWHELVAEWTEQGRDDSLQEYVGYCLHVGSMPIHRALLLVGGGSNGKSTFLHVVCELLGENNTTSMELQTLANEKDAVADFYGALANIDDDLSSRGLGRGVGMFKKLVAGDRVRGRKLYEDAFEFEATGKHLYAANEVPDVSNNVDDEDEAFWRRWLLIEFPNHYPRNERDSGLRERWTEDESLSAVLNWAIDGRSQLLEQGYFTGEYGSAFEKRDRWRTWGDSLEEFISEHIVCDENADNVSTSYAYNRYKKWCRERSKDTVGQRKFTATLRDSGMNLGYARSVRIADAEGQPNGYKTLGFTGDVPEIQEDRENGQQSIDGLSGGSGD